MPELRLEVLALQERLAYAPTFDAALNDLCGAAGAPATQPTSTSAPSPAPASSDVQALIAEAAKDLAEYQRLTAEGKLAEAGQRIEHLKRTLDELSKRR